MRVQAKNLKPGDITRGTPRGKVEVTLEKLDGMRAGQVRTATWNANTEISIQTLLINAETAR